MPLGVTAEIATASQSPLQFGKRLAITGSKRPCPRLLPSMWLEKQQHASPI
jgi:hypothetical protein